MLNNKTNPYPIVDLSPEGYGKVAFQELKVGKHCMYNLLEVDVTVARKFIEDCKA